MDHPTGKKISRRQFIKGPRRRGVASSPFARFHRGDPIVYAAEESDLVIAKSGSPAQLLQAAMAPMGGMARFVKKGQRVVIKANIAWARTPEQAAPTTRIS